MAEELKLTWSSKPTTVLSTEDGIEFCNVVLDHIAETECQFQFLVDKVTRIEICLSFLARSFPYDKAAATFGLKIFRNQATLDSEECLRSLSDLKSEHGKPGYYQKMDQAADRLEGSVKRTASSVMTDMDEFVAKRQAIRQQTRTA